MVIDCYGQNTKRSSAVGTYQTALKVYQPACLVLRLGVLVSVFTSVLGPDAPKSKTFAMPLPAVIRMIWQVT